MGTVWFSPHGTEWTADTYEKALEQERDSLIEQLEAERREEWREGIVNVLDHEGKYLGCMGSETWAWMLNGGIERMKDHCSRPPGVCYPAKEPS